MILSLVHFRSLINLFMVHYNLSSSLYYSSFDKPVSLVSQGHTALILWIEDLVCSQRYLINLSYLVTCGQVVYLGHFPPSFSNWVVAGSYQPSFHLHSCNPDTPVSNPLPNVHHKHTKCIFQDPRLPQMVDNRQLDPEKLMRSIRAKIWLWLLSKTPISLDLPFELTLVSGIQ